MLCSALPAWGVGWLARRPLPPRQALGARSRGLVPIPSTVLCRACAGLLNVDAPDVVDGLLQRIADDISACLRPGGDVRQGRLLLRFLTALVVTNVVHASAAVAVIQSFVDAALGIASASESAGATARPRPRALGPAPS